MELKLMEIPEHKQIVCVAHAFPETVTELTYHTFNNFCPF